MFSLYLLPCHKFTTDFCTCQCNSSYSWSSIMAFAKYAIQMKVKTCSFSEIFPSPSFAWDLCQYLAMDAQFQWPVLEGFHLCWSCVHPGGTRPSFSTKIIFPIYRNSHQDKTVLYIFTLGIPVLIRQNLDIETTYLPRLPRYFNWAPGNI